MNKLKQTILVILISVIFFEPVLGRTLLDEKLVLEDIDVNINKTYSNKMSGLVYNGESYLYLEMEKTGKNIVSVI